MSQQPRTYTNFDPTEKNICYGSDITIRDNVWVLYMRTYIQYKANAARVLLTLPPHDSTAAAMGLAPRLSLNVFPPLRNAITLQDEDTVKAQSQPQIYPARLHMLSHMLTARVSTEFITSRPTPALIHL